MVAFISARTAVALLNEGDVWQRVTYEHPDEVVPCSRAEAEFLLRNMNDVETLDLGMAHEVSDRLQDAVDETEAIDLVLMLMNPQFEDETRIVAATELEELLLYPEIAEAIQNVLLGSPLPESADPIHGIKLANQSDCVMSREFIERLQELQPAIVSVRDAWGEVAASKSEYKLDWSMARGHFVRYGLLKQLCLEVAQTGKAAKFVFAAMGMDQLKRTIPHYRQIVVSLAASFRSHDDGDSNSANSDATPQSEHRSKSVANRGFNNHEAKLKIDELKKDVIDAMRLGKTRRFNTRLEYLISFQHEHSDLTDLSRSLCDLAQIAGELGDYRIQLQLTTRATEVNASDSWSWQQHALALNRSGKRAEAELAIERAIDLAPDDVVAKNGRASVFVLTGEWDKALSALPKNETTRTRDDWICLHIRAMVALKTGDFEAAGEMLSHGIAYCRFHDCLDYYHGAFALLKMRQDSLQEAATEISKMSDGFRVPRLTLGCQLAAKRKDGRLALEIFQQLPSPSSPQAAETFDELKRLAMGQSGAHSDEWLFHQQLDMLAA